MAGLDLKMLGRALVGGLVTAGIGTLLLPIVNQLITFVPQTKLLIEGLTPHVAIAYGIGFAVADWAIRRMRWLS